MTSVRHPTYVCGSSTATTAKSYESEKCRVATVFSLESAGIISTCTAGPDHNGMNPEGDGDIYLQHSSSSAATTAIAATAAATTATQNKPLDVASPSNDKIAASQKRVNAVQNATLQHLCVCASSRLNSKIPPAAEAWGSRAHSNTPRMRT
jgi:hypothetical protein